MGHYEVQARTTEIFGRVLGSCRHHHFVVDGPVANGCPGEAVAPAELFLSGVATCAVELMQVVAQEQGLPLQAAQVSVSGSLDPDHPVRSDFKVFNAVRLQFQLKGVSEEQGAQLIAAFQGR